MGNSENGFFCLHGLFYEAETCCPKYWLYELTTGQREGSGGCWNFTWGYNCGWYHHWWSQGKPCPTPCSTQEGGSAVQSSGSISQVLGPGDPKLRGCFNLVLPFVKTSFGQTQSQQKHFPIICKFKWKQWFENRDVYVKAKHKQGQLHGFFTSLLVI